MYCKNCGTEIKENASFCHRCGQPISKAGQQTREAAQSAVSAQSGPGVEYFEARRSCDLHAEAAANHQAVAEAYERSLACCAIGGLVLALVVGPLSAGSGSMALFWTFSAFFFPFGLAPLHHWVDEHGYFIVFNWIILIVLAVILFFVAMIACPLYICWAGWQIYSNLEAARRESELAQGFEEQIAALA